MHHTSLCFQGNATRTVRRPMSLVCSIHCRNALNAKLHTATIPHHLGCSLDAIQQRHLPTMLHGAQHVAHDYKAEQT